MVSTHSMVFPSVLVKVFDYDIMQNWFPHSCVCVWRKIFKSTTVDSAKTFACAVCIELRQETYLFENWASNLLFCNFGLNSTFASLTIQIYFILLHFFILPVLKSIFLNYCVLWAINQIPSSLRSSFLELWKWLWKHCFVFPRVLLFKPSLRLTWASRFFFFLICKWISLLYSLGIRELGGNYVESFELCKCSLLRSGFDLLCPTFKYLRNCPEIVPTFTLQMYYLHITQITGIFMFC